MTTPITAPTTTPTTTPTNDRMAAALQVPETHGPALGRDKVNPAGHAPAGYMPAAKLSRTQGGPQDLEPGLGVPDDLAPGIKAAALRSGMRYESFVQQLISCAFAQVKFWQQSDVERLFWLADRLGLDPLERDLIALEQRDAGPFPASVAFMITLDGWVKLLHRHPRFRGLSFEEGPIDEHGLPLWQSCSLYWEGFACPWVVREWACEHRSLHESWLNHPRRMLRHKALTQCARLALGVGGGFWAASGELEGSPSGQALVSAPSHHYDQKGPGTTLGSVMQPQALNPSTPLNDALTKRPTTAQALKSALAAQMPHD